MDYSYIMAICDCHKNILHYQSCHFFDNYSIVIYFIKIKHPHYNNL